MPAAADELVGREREVALLEAALDDLGADSGRVLEVAGEPGIGKSRLLEELSTLAEDRGNLVLPGRAAEFESDFPFGVVVDALDDYLGSLGERTCMRLGEGVMEELGAIFPGFGPSGEVVTIERYRLHRAVALLLARLGASRDRGLVLVLDDVHWADEASIELFSHFLHRGLPKGVLLALGYRSAQAPENLVRALAPGARDERAERIDLEPLSKSDVGELLGADVDPGRRSVLYRESGGNPFYVLELARASDHPGAVPEDAPLSFEDVPRAVAAALEGELADRGEQTRFVARAAAVAADPFDPELAAATAAVEEDAALSAIDALIDLDLVRNTDVPRRFRFRHPLLRRAVYESAPEGWRLGAHGRAAAALAARGASAAMCAHHVERAAHPGDADAIALLAEAGHASAPRAPATAARWFEAALRLLPERGTDGARRLELLVPLAAASGSAGDLERSRKILDEVLGLLPEQMSEIRARVVASCARIEHLLGHREDARAMLEDALAELPEPNSSEAGALKVALASDCFFEGDFDGMRPWAEGTLELARSLPDATLHAVGCGLLAGAHYLAGEVPAALESAAESAGHYDALDESELGAHLHAFAWFAVTELFLSRVDDGVRHSERGLSAAAASGQAYLLPLMRNGLALGSLFRGSLDEAAEHAEAAVEGARLSNQELFQAWTLSIRSWVARAAGDTREAARYGEQSVAAAGGRTDPVSVMSGASLGAALIEGDEPERGRDLLLEAAGGPDLPPIELPFRPHWYELLTQAEIALGRHAQARQWADRAEASSELGLDVRTAEAMIARARVELAEGGDAAAVAAMAMGAAGLAERGGGPIVAARARLLAGPALAEAGERERALAELERARTDLADRGAARLTDEAARELRRLGKRVARRGRRGAGESGVAALSGRELEIAELVAAGKTNKEIAAELYLSPKTIEGHLSRVFEKLEVGKRASVAGAIERERAAAG